MQKTKTILSVFILTLAIGNSIAQNTTLTKTWQTTYSSTSNYCYPLKLGYDIPVIGGSPSLYEYAKTGNGEISIRKINPQSGLVQNSALILNNASLGKDFFMDVYVPSERQNVFGMLAYSDGIGFLTTDGVINTNGHNPQKRKFITVNPVTLAVQSTHSDTCNFVNPADNYIRNAIIRVSSLGGIYEYMNVTNQYMMFLGSPMYRPHSVLATKYPLFTAGQTSLFSTCESDSMGTYTAISSGATSHFITNSQNGNSGDHTHWFSNYYDSANPLKKTVLIGSAGSGNVCFNQNRIEITCDTCQAFEVQAVEKLNNTLPTDKLLVLYKKQVMNDIFVRYHLRFYDLYHPVCDSLVLNTDILIDSMTDIISGKESRVISMDITDNEIYIVIKNYNTLYLYCYNHAGILQWTHNQFLSNDVVSNDAGVGVCVDSTGLYVGSSSGFGTPTPDHYHIVKWNALTGTKDIDYIDATNKGFITDMQLSQDKHSIFVTGVDATANYLTSTIRYDLATTGINDFNNSTVQIDAFPNPCKNKLIVDLSNEKIKALASILYLTDVNGKKVTEMTIQPNTNQLQINMEIVPQGIYFLHLVTDKGTLSKKIVKQ